MSRIPIRSLLVFWLFLLSSIAFLDRTNISIAGPSIQRELGIHNIELGWIFSAFLLAYALFQVPSGWLAVRLGPRRVLAGGVLWWGVFSALTTVAGARLAHSLLLLIAIRFALGCGEAVMYPASNQFVARWIPMAERGRANGWIFAGVGASGLMLPALNWIVTRQGWRASFWVCAAAGVALGIGWYLLARDTPEQHPRIPADELRRIQSGRPAQSLPHPARKIPWRAAIFNRNVIALTLSCFTFGYVAWIFFSWFFLYLAQSRGLNLKTSAMATTLPYLAATVCCLAGGAISDTLARRLGQRAGRCGLSVFSLACTSVFLVAGSRAHSAWAAVVILTGGIGALYLSQSTFWTVTADIAGELSGIVSAIMNMGGQIGGALTASLTPWLAARMGWAAAFGFAAALAAIGAALWLLVDPSRRLHTSPQA